MFRKKFPKDQDSNDTPEIDKWTGPGQQVAPGQANLISSVVYRDENIKIHTPLIDLDVEHFYTQSTTPRHGHLAINVQLDHDTYGELLRVLHKCGIIGEGILKQYERDGQTNLRLPGIKKGDDSAEDVASNPPHVDSQYNPTFNPLVPAKAPKYWADGTPD